jgi:hypothetical protein
LVLLLLPLLLLLLQLTLLVEPLRFLHTPAHQSSMQQACH